jgi:hypothetical protein
VYLLQKINGFLIASNYRIIDLAANLNGLDSPVSLFSNQNGRFNIQSSWIIHFVLATSVTKSTPKFRSPFNRPCMHMAGMAQSPPKRSTQNSLKAIVAG